MVLFLEEKIVLFRAGLYIYICVCVNLFSSWKNRNMGQFFFFRERNILQHVNSISPRFQDGLKAFSDSPIIGEVLSNNTLHEFPIIFI